MKGNGHDFSGKTILMVNTTSWGFSDKFIFKTLKKMGLSIVCLNKEKNWAEPYVDEWIIADNTNHVEAIQAVKDFISQNPRKIDGVLTFLEDEVLLTSKIVEKFNFLGTPHSVAKKVRNKYLFRQFCRDNNLPAPRHTILLKSVKSIGDLPEDFTFPAVIKPIFGCGSAYVIKVNNKEELANTFNYIKKNIAAATAAEGSFFDGLDILVEGYIDGDEVDVDIVLQNGKIKFYSISDNYQTREPFFVETGQAIPTSLSVKNQADLIGLAEEVLEKLGIQNSIVHFEAKSTPNGPVPIELGLRMGGDEVHSFVKGAWGVDLVENAAKIALGAYIPKIQKPDAPKKYITGVYFLSNYSGVLTKINVNEEIRTKKYLEELHFFKKVGEPVLAPPEGYEFMGWTTVSGYSLPDAQENLKEALKFIDYEVAKFTPDSSIGRTSRENSFSHASLNTKLLIQAAKIEKIKLVAGDDQRDLRIGIASNLEEDESEGNGESVIQPSLAKIIEKTLKERGYRTTLFDFNNIEKVMKELKTKAKNVDLIFNACEKINNSIQLKSHAAALLDILQLPYTGSSPFALSLCRDKIQSKKLLAYHGIPTPKWDYVYTVDEEVDETLKYPLIVKPSNMDDSFGITNESVVTNKEDLQREIRKVVEDLHCPALIEEYIEGDEYDVPILGNDEADLQVLPLSRAIFKDMPLGKWHIITNEMKISAQSLAEWGIILQRPPKNIDKKLETLITEIALDTYNILECRDYGRVEIRVGQDGNPYVLELNANPPLVPSSSISDVAQLAGLSYEELLEKIITLAVKRYQQNSSQLT
ncbi:MAG: ATP-grasp domain-containing protein [Candidatus Gribaldobacteria bacterium]|nr:ATP-grasp domain-containing protein [Candidatus Gribaldobacteria bacterium]